MTVQAHENAFMMPAQRPDELPADLWQMVLAHDAEAAASAVGVSRELHALAAAELRRMVPPELKLLRASQTCVQSQLCEALLLPTEVVASHPHRTQRRSGGGCYHVYNTEEAIAALMRASGGVGGLAARATARRVRLDAKRHRDEERPEEEARRRARLVKGLAVLRLPLRGDSDVCAAYVRTGNDAFRALSTAARMHWLHEHTGGAYAAAVEEGVADEADHRGFYPGIYRAVTQEVQVWPQFRLPLVLPWLPQFATTREALDAALRAADADEHRKRARRMDLHTRREAALVQRQAVFGEAFMAAVVSEASAPEGSAPTAAWLREQARSFGVPRHESLHYFDAVVTTRVAVTDVCTLATRLVAVARTRDALCEEEGGEAANAFQRSVRADFDGDADAMRAAAVASAEARRRKEEEARSRREEARSRRGEKRSRQSRREGAGKHS